MRIYEQIYPVCHTNTIRLISQSNPKWIRLSQAIKDGLKLKGDSDICLHLSYYTPEFSHLCVEYIYPKQWAKKLIIDELEFNRSLVLGNLLTVLDVEDWR